MNRAEWLEGRRKGIGGSDVAAIFGLDPWRSSLDVWRSKVEPVPEPTDDERFLLKLGHLLEPVIAGLYSEQTERELFVPVPEIVTHLKYPEIVGSPDRLAPQDGRVVELKSEHQFADKFGDPGSDQVPDHYVLQCAAYMAVTDLDRTDVAVLHGGFKFSVYQLQRDRELETVIIDHLRQFWADHVLKGIPPPLDASESWGNYLAHKYPFNRGPIVPVDENSQPAIMRHVFNALNYADVMRDFKTKLAGAQNEVKAFIAENDGIRGPWGKITWRLCKDSTETRINFDKLVEDLAKAYQIPEIAITELREKHMESVVTKKGGRRFVAKRAKEVGEAEMVPGTDQETLFDAN